MKSEESQMPKVRILIVEDSPTQAQQLVYVLEKQGFTVDATTNGREALGYLEHHKPSMVISDIVMPELDGYGLCKAIKSDETLMDIPVILVTTLFDTDDVIRGIECGADNFIFKPYEENYLISRVERILTSVQQRQDRKSQAGDEGNFDERRHLFTAAPSRILDLFVSTYEQAIRLNTEVNQREAALAHSNQVLNGLYRIADSLNHATDAQQVAELALERVMDLPGIQTGWITLLDGNTGHRLVAAINLPPALERAGALEGDCACRRRLAAGELDSVTNIVECERLSRTTDGARGMRYHASIPLRYGDRTLGMMNLVGPHKGLFNEAELKVLRSVGSQLSAALQRAHLYQHLEKLVEERTAKLTAEINERTRVERAQARLVSIIEATPDLMATSDLDGQMLYCNQAGLRLLGLPVTQDVSGLNIQHCHPEWAKKLVLDTGIPAAIAFGSWTGETALMRQDGAEIPVSQVIIAHKGADGMVEYLSTICRDITERLATEEQLRQTQKMQAVGQLTAGIAHDFNNILGAVIGNLDLIMMQAATDPAAAVTCAKAAIEAALSGADFVKSLLAFARQQPLQAKPMDIKKTIANIVPLLRPSIGARIEIKTSTTADLWPAMSDTALVESALLNLALNARDAMPDGGTLTLDAANVTVDGDLLHADDRLKAGDYVVVTVSDSGTGMAPEVMAHAFEPFFTTKGVGAGTGLGLSMVLGSMQQMGGTARISSAPGHGTTIQLFLPRATADADIAIVPTPAPAQSTGMERLLVVEDHPIIREAVQEMIQNLGYTAEVVENGDAALEAWDRGERFDLVFSDVIMRGQYNGVSLTRALRERDPNVKVLLTSGFAVPAEFQADMEELGLELLLKPYRHATLAARLRAILDRKV